MESIARFKSLASSGWRDSSVSSMATNFAVVFVIEMPLFQCVSLMFCLLLFVLCLHPSMGMGRR